MKNVLTIILSAAGGAVLGVLGKTYWDEKNLKEKLTSLVNRKKGDEGGENPGDTGAGENAAE